MVLPILVAAAFLFSLTALAVRLRPALALRKPDFSRPRGSAAAGVAYAYSIGMLPWTKQSGREHALAYVRGALFHVGIFLSFAVLVLTLTPWLAGFPAGQRTGVALFLAITCLAGLLGLWDRFRQRNLRALSVPEDYTAIVVVAAFVGLAAAAVRWPGLTGLFQAWSAWLLLYLPFSKLRHVWFFFFMRYFYGSHFGHRGVLPHPRMLEAR